MTQSFSAFICLNLFPGRASEYFVAFLGQEIQDEVVISDTITYEIVITNPETETAHVNISTINGDEIAPLTPIPGGGVTWKAFSEVSGIIQCILTDLRNATLHVTHVYIFQKAVDCKLPLLP